jgi:glycosyltransferase involved in cell wall biosynthesis
MIRTFPSAIVANSLSTLETAGLSGVKGAVIPSPVIYDPVMSHSPLDQRGRSCFVVGIVGRLAEWKGQDVFLRAFAMAFPDGDEQALVVGSAMFGEDAFADHLMRLASQLGIAERVSFTGFTDDVTSKLADMDVLVHASVVAEPFGQVIVEGMVCGLPVVATRGGGPSEIIEDGVTGLLYEPGNDEELARILLQLEGAPQLRQQLGQAAMREAVRYRPSTIAAQMEEVYRCVMNRPKP